MNPPSISNLWRQLATDILVEGTASSPRGLLIRELICNTTKWPISYPIMLLKHRKLNYRFMLSEALWILTGDSRVSTITKHCAKMWRYSDDGITMSGAYGPRIVTQLRYIVDTLIADVDSRQAVLTIWERNPRPSKDIPCTVSMQFLVRGGHLDLIATMRSSDVWLGIPYDVFSFSMVGTYVWLQLRAHYSTLVPGCLYIVAGSQHIYESNVPAAQECVSSIMEREKIEYDYTHLKSPDHLLDTLNALISTLMS